MKLAEINRSVIVSAWPTTTLLPGLFMLAVSRWSEAAESARPAPIVARRLFISMQNYENDKSAVISLSGDTRMYPPLIIKIAPFP